MTHHDNRGRLTRAKKPSGRPPGTGALNDGVGRLDKITIRLAREERTALRAHARRQRLPVSALIIRTLKDAGLLEERPAQNPSRPPEQETGMRESSTWWESEPIADWVYIPDIPKHVPTRDGKRVSIPTVYRWTLSGLAGIRLRTFQIGAKRATTIGEIRRWIRATTAAARLEDE